MSVHPQHNALDPPAILKPELHGIPPEMRAVPRWLTWRLEWKPPTPKHPAGNWTKVPYNARTGRLGSSTKPERSTSFEIAWRCYQDSLTGKSLYSGIGFVLGDGWVAVDIDGYRDPDTGALDTRGREVLERIHGYCEVSPSGTGVHVVCRGAVPAGRREWDEPDRDHTGVAIYSDGRYLAITGCHLAESAPIEDCTTEIAALHAWLSSSNGNPGQRVHTADDRLQHALAFDAKLQSLWNGNISYYPSQSEADLALCMKLIYWFGRDAATIDDLFRQSGLMREKWNREDYRQRTLRTALDWQDQTYQENAGGTKRKSHTQAHAASVDVDAIEPPVAALNAVTIFSGKIRFETLRRHGSSFRRVLKTVDRRSGEPQSIWARSLVPRQFCSTPPAS